MTDMVVWRGVRKLGVYIEIDGDRILVVIDRQTGEVKAEKVATKKQALERFDDIVYGAEFPCAVANATGGW